MTDLCEPAGRPASPAGDPAAAVGVETSGRRRPRSPADAARMEEKVRQVEVAISLVLRIGVVVSVLVIAVGLGLMFAHHGAYAAVRGHVSYKALTSAHAAFPHSFGALGRSLAHGDGRGVIVLGVLVLVLTPVLRVAVGVLSFLYEKDVPMALVTLAVLVVLICSFALAGG